MIDDINTVFTPCIDFDDKIYVPPSIFDIKILLSTQIGMTGNVGTGNILSCAPTKSLS